MPVIRQTGASDCGLTALEMILQYHGTPCDRPTLRRAFGAVVGGSTLETLRTIAESFGLDAAGFDVPADQLHLLPAPAILHWQGSHFVVFEGLRRGEASIVDPAGGRLRVPLAELAGEFGGRALVVEPKVPQEPDSPPAGPEWLATHSLLTPWLRQERGGVALLVLHALAASAAAVVAALYAGTAIASSPDGLPALAVSAIGGVAAAWLGFRAGTVEARLTARLGHYLAETFAHMVARAPYEFLASRTSRFLENLASDLDPTVSITMPSLRAVRLLLLALAASAALFLVSGSIGAAVLVLAGAIIVAAAWQTTRWRARARRWRPTVQAAREWNRAILARPSDLRAAAGLTPALERWLNARRAAAALLGASAVAAPGPSLALLGFAFGATALAVGGAYLRGSLAPGDAISALLLGTTALVAMQAATREALRFRVWVAALVHLADSCREVAGPGLAKHGDGASTQGVVVCCAMGYIAGGEEALGPVELEVEAGEGIALVGDAAARTTFSALLLGLLRPTSGSITIDGLEPAMMTEGERSALVAGVLDGAEPLAATILDNFRLVKPGCTRDEVLAACARVGLQEWLSSLPLHELTPVARGMLSGAASRLLCLARLLPRLPRVLVLDGTLDELDAPVARALAGSLVADGCAVVLSTARADIVPPDFRAIRLAGAHAAEAGSV